MVPSGWSLVKLGDILTLGSGDAKPADLQKEYSDDSPYPVYGGNNIMGYSSQKNSSDSVILIGRVGEYCGVTRYINKACWITDNALYTKTVSSEIDKEYLVSKLKKFDLSRLRNKGGQPLVSQKPIYAVKLPMPPLPEQRKIAKILSTWDKAISTTERLIDNSKQQKKALMQQLLTGKKRLLDDSGKPFEGEWEEVKLSQLVKVIGGNAFKSEEFKTEGIPLVKISNIKPDYSICLDSTVFIAENEKFEKFKVMKGHVLIAMSGATTGKVGCYQSEKFAYLNQRVGRFDVKQGRTINQYLFQLLKLPKVQHEILIDAVGGAQPNISNKDIERIKISVPAVKEQQKIASVLSNADQEIELLEQQLADLKQEKKALMQQLLTGKRRVAV